MKNTPARIRNLIVASMLRGGLPRSAVAIHIGITRRIVESVELHMKEEEDFCRDSVRKPVRKSGNIIKSRAVFAEVSLLMDIYRNISGNLFHDHIDVFSLYESYIIYEQYREEIGLPIREKLKMVDAWSLARDLVTKEAQYIECPRCKTFCYVAYEQILKSHCGICPPVKQKA